MRKTQNTERERERARARLIDTYGWMDYWHNEINTKRERERETDLRNSMCECVNWICWWWNCGNTEMNWFFWVSGAVLLGSQPQFIH